MCISYSQPVLDQLSCLHLNGCKGSRQPQGFGRSGCWTPAKTMMDFTLLPFMLGRCHTSVLAEVRPQVYEYNNSRGN